MPKKLTNEEVQINLDKKFNGDYILISNYTNMKEPIKVRHKCGYEYEIKRAREIFENKCLCPKCTEKTPVNRTCHKLTEEMFLKRLKETTNDYKYISGFKDSNTKLLLKHEICGNEFYVSPHMFLGNKQTRCPFCANIKRGKINNEIDLEKTKIAYIKSKENINEIFKKFNIKNIKIKENQFLFAVKYLNSILCILIFNKYEKNKYNLFFFYTSSNYINYKPEFFEETYKKIVKFLEKRNNN